MPIAVGWPQGRDIELNVFLIFLVCDPLERQAGWSHSVLSCVRPLDGLMAAALIT